MKKNTRRITAIVTAAFMLLGIFAPVESVCAKAKKCTISTEDPYLAVEADVKLTGKGSGYHAKLVLAAPKSAVSLGIQYDAFARAPYTGKTMILVENVYSNNHGGQRYYRPKNISIKPGKTCHLMITLSESGYINTYYNYHKIASYRNKNLAHTKVWPRVEGCARLKNDKVNAEFKNIRVKSDIFDELDDFRAVKIDVSPRIHSRILSKSHVIISGILTGIKRNKDWDSAYDRVSGTVQYCDD